MTASGGKAPEAGAPETETEITPEMIAAGVAALTSWYQELVWPVVDAYPEIVRIVYRAMEASRT